MAQDREASDAGVLLSIVVPVYMEEKNVTAFLDRTVPVLEKIGRYEIVFALDPGADSTESLIRAAAAKNPSIGLIVFSRRFGQPAAVMAGVLNCRGAWCAVIDVDLQDPPELLESMVEKAREGFDVVNAKRRTRLGEPILKTLVASVWYAILNRISDVRIPPNVGEFRLLSRRIIEELRLLHERHGFLRGLVPLVGFSQAVIEFDRDARFAGTGNYNRYLGSFRIGMNGIFSFSTVPLQLTMWAGFSVSAISAVAIIVMIIKKLLLGENYPMGIPTITVLVLFIGGVQLIAIGILGEYIGRIYDEVRRRPMYIVARTLNMDLVEPRGPGEPRT